MRLARHCKNCRLGWTLPEWQQYGVLRPFDPPDMNGRSGRLEGIRRYPSELCRCRLLSVALMGSID